MQRRKPPDQSAVPSVPVFEKLIVIAPYHAVVQPSDRVGASAVEPLEIIVGGQDVYLPAVKRRKMPSHRAVELLRLLYSGKPFTVGRVADYRAASAFGFYLQRVLGKDLYALPFLRA